MNIYCLKLEKDKFYIGKSSDVNERILSHFNKNGSEWTKKYKPLEIMEVIENCDEFDEDKYT